jgi:hypothetical protein
MKQVDLISRKIQVGARAAARAHYERMVTWEQVCRIALEKQENKTK